MVLLFSSEEDKQAFHGLALQDHNTVYYGFLGFANESRTLLQIVKP
jgi:hypothetical protein